MKIKPLHVFAILCCLFICYSLSIYFITLNNNRDNRLIDSKLAVEGKLVWQKFNCQNCHQIYGLGGYLGPDLTNFYSSKENAIDVLGAMVKTGYKQMPSFIISDAEFVALTEFLKSTDASGIADPRKFEIQKNGMIQPSELIIKQN